MNGESMRFVFALGFGARARGLLGSSHNWGDGEAILVIAPCKSVHTFGMCYPIDVAFVDKHGAVMRVERDVVPGRLLVCRHAYAALERPSADTPWTTAGMHMPLSFR